MSVSKARTLSRGGAAAVAAVIVLASAQPSRAQIFGWPWSSRAPQPAPPVTTSQLAEQLAGRGYRLLALRRNGGVYLADASDRSGHRRRLILDAFSGAILQVFAYAPTRSPAGVGEGERNAPLSNRPPAFASREPTVIPRDEDEPDAETGSDRPSAPRARTRETRPKHTLAKREDAAPSIKTEHSATPSAAIPEPASGPAATAAPSAETRPSSSPTTSGRQPRQEATAAKAPTPPPPPQAVTAPAPARPRAPVVPANGPGYANGVPINPLD